jgi:hypothetical protein
MSKISRSQLTLDLVLNTVAEVPGQAAGDYRRLLGAPVGSVNPFLRLALKAKVVDVCRNGHRKIYFLSPVQGDRIGPKAASTVAAPALARKAR